MGGDFSFRFFDKLVCALFTIDSAPLSVYNEKRNHSKEAKAGSKTGYAIVLIHKSGR